MWGKVMSVKAIRIFLHIDTFQNNDRIYNQTSSGQTKGRGSMKNPLTSHLFCYVVNIKILNQYVPFAPNDEALLTDHSYGA